MTTKLKEIVFIQVGKIYRCVGIYVTAGTVMQGEDLDPGLQVEFEGENYYEIRRQGKKKAYDEKVGFFDTVNPEFNDLPKLQIRGRL